MNIEEIKRYLPHRYPFLMIDRVEELEVNSHIIAYKNVSYNESFFQGHFPNISIMPGVLTLEAMAQAAGILSSKTIGQEIDGETIYLLVGAEKVRYKKPIVPGDCIKITLKILRVKSGIWQYHGIASVEDKTACEATIYCKGAQKTDFFNSTIK